MLFRKLSSEEEQSFRSWAHENYVPFEPIQGIWHPVIQDECAKINAASGQNFDPAKEFGVALDVPQIPADFPVQPLDDDDNPPGKATCGTCGRSWDDAKATSLTPAPSARCPFEYFHS